MIDLTTAEGVAVFSMGENDGELLRFLDTQCGDKVDALIERTVKEKSSAFTPSAGIEEVRQMIRDAGTQFAVSLPAQVGPKVRDLAKKRVVAIGTTLLTQSLFYAPLGAAVSDAEKKVTLQ